jgi:hypothetical protein
VFGWERKTMLLYQVDLAFLKKRKIDEAPAVGAGWEICV